MVISLYTTVINERESKMKVCIIGGTGYVGSYIIDSLINAGHSANILVRSGSKEKLREHNSITAIPGDVSDQHAIDNCHANCDALIYLIGILREDPAKGITFKKLQTEGFKNCLASAKKHGIKRVILMSANGVEAQTVAYQKSKYAAEDLLRKSDVNWTIFRPGLIFGDPRGRMEFCGTLLNELVSPPIPAAVFFNNLNIFSAGDQMVAPVFVEDVADAFVNALEHESTYSHTYPLTGPVTLSWKETIRYIARVAGKPNKLFMPAPAWGVKFVAGIFDQFPWFPITRDQVTILMQGNTATDHSAFSILGIRPTGFDEEQLTYLTNKN